MSNGLSWPARVAALLTVALLFVCCGAPVSASTLKPIEVGTETERRDITSAGDLYDGRGDTLQIETAVGADGATGRISVNASTRGSSPNWFVFALRNPTDKPLERWLVTERYDHARSGIIWPDLDARRIDSVTPSLGFVPERLAFDSADAFRLTIEPGQTVTFVAELAGDRVPRLQLWRGGDYEKRIRDRQLFHGILLGIVGLLAVFLISIFAANHQAIFPAAALFAWMVLAYLCVDFGFWHKLFNIRPEESAQYRAAGEAGMSASLLVFAHTFLRIGRWHGFIRMLAGLAMLSQLALIALAFLDPRLAATFARLSLAGVLGLSAIVTTYLVMRGQDRALAIVPTWILFGVWLFGAALLLSGRLQSDVVVNGLIAGLVLLVVLIGFTVTQFAFRANEQMLGGSLDDQQLRAMAIDNTGAAIFEWSASRDEVRVGAMVDTALGLSPQERREPLSRFVERMHPADRERLVQTLSALKGRSSGAVRVDFRLRHADNSYRSFELDGSGVAVKDPRLARCVGLVRETTDQRRAHERLLQDAVHDNLTQLPNRSLFLDRLEVGLARTRNEQLICPTVFFVDLDRFKSLNNALGLTIGDSLLITVARRLQRLVRPGDALARLGGDQFALAIMQTIEERDQRLLADEIRAAIKGSINIAGQEVVLTGSIGIAVFDPKSPAANAEDLLADAEVAMHRARRSGPDRIETYAVSMRVDKDQRRSIEQELKAAIERKDLQVVFQPIMYLRTAILAGFEASLRWQHPRLGLLDPSEFAPLQDSSDLVRQLGANLVRAAVAEAQRWHVEYARPEAPIFVAINVSRRQLFGPDLVNEVRHVTARNVIPKGALRIDVCEALVLDNPERATELLKSLSAAGARLSLDEFGAGYSSLAFLSAFPIDTIKIDGALVHAASQGGPGAAMLRSIVAMAHELGKTVVATGVEVEGDIGLLRTIGCDFAQGTYYSGKLASPREALALVRHLRKSERRLKRTGLFRLRSRRIDDDALSTADASATPDTSSTAGADSQLQTSAPTNPVAPLALENRPAAASPSPPLRETVKTTLRPRPVLRPAPAPQAQPSVAVMRPLLRPAADAMPPPGPQPRPTQPRPTQPRPVAASMPPPIPNAPRAPATLALQSRPPVTRVPEPVQVLAPANLSQPPPMQAADATVVQPVSMPDRSLARLQAEIARAVPEAAEAQPRPQMPVTPPPMTNFSTLPPAIADSLARLAGVRVAERKAQPSDDPSAAAGRKSG